MVMAKRRHSGTLSPKSARYRRVTFDLAALASRISWNVRKCPICRWLPPPTSLQGSEPFLALGALVLALVLVFFLAATGETPVIRASRPFYRCLTRRRHETVIV